MNAELCSQDTTPFVSRMRLICITNIAGTACASVLFEEGTDQNKLQFEVCEL